MRYVIFALFSGLFISGCVSISEDPYTSWAKKVTPVEFKDKETWGFLLVDKNGIIIHHLSVRLTSDPAETCTSGQWRSVEILNEYPKRAKSFLGKAAYEIKGAAFIMDLTANLCDNGYELKGELKSEGFKGTHYPVGLFGGKIQGVFYAFPIKT